MKRGPRFADVTAIFGGSFDPPHRGHRIAAEGLLTNPGVARVVILPSGRLPWKTETISANARLRLTEATFKGNPRISVSPLELERASRSAGPTYSFESIEALRGSEAGGDPSRLAFVLGSDALPGLPRWHRFPEVLKLCHWIVLARKGTPSKEARETIRSLETSGLLRGEGSDRWCIPDATGGGPLTLAWVETEAPALSSTMIREHVARTGLLPPGALEPAAEAVWRKLFASASGSS